MATSSKYDLSSGSPDRPLYPGGHRGSHLAPPLDRSGSFRESMENPNSSSLSNNSRAVVTQVDVSSFFQCLRFDPKVVVADHKSSRQGDFKRHLNVALGISADDSPTGSSKGKLLPCPLPEEIKRVKAGLRESSVKARERMKIFNEALSVFNKFFPNIPTKKRSRSEGFSNDRPGPLPPSPSVGKISHAVAGGFELEQQKLDERTKAAVPNKRTRTSLADVRMDVRSNTLVRPSGPVDRDREMLRLANGGGVQGEERTLSIGVDGWEKSKMKKKRSGIKPESSQSFLPTKPNDGYREPKQGMQQRVVADARSRLNNDSHGFRPGAANGAVGVGKADGVSQPSGLGTRPSVLRTEMDSNSVLNDRRERPVGSDKERVNLRAVNKSNVRDEFNSASPTSNSKMNASVRGPRSGSAGAPKLSPSVHRATAPNDWELSHCANKPPAAVGSNNRKRTAAARSSSPPVAQWAGQRPQKISRTARRTNFVPIVPNNDETSCLDASSDIASNELGFAARRLSSNSPQQIKLKSDPLSSTTLSESEESGATDSKSKDKGKRSDDIGEKPSQSVHKVSTLVLPSRKNKLVSGEDLGDGVRRQGRTGRGFTSTRSLMPMTVEKLGSVGTAKQLRSARLGFDKTERTGRPATRKLSDRKAYTRQKHAAISTSADFLVGSDDGHEELLAAANAVISSAHAFPSSFWRQMESFFGFISDGDITYLKQQGNLESTVPTLPRFSSNTDGTTPIPNGYGLSEHEREGVIGIDAGQAELIPEQLMQSAGDHKVIPFYQRLIAALISEEDSVNGNEDLKFDTFATGFELDGDLESNGSDHSTNFQCAGHAAFNGYKITGKRDSDDGLDIEMFDLPGPVVHSNFGPSPNGVLPDEALIQGMAVSEFQYGNMKISEKLLLEARSIGIFPELVSVDAEMEGEGIGEDIRKLEESYYEQVSRKQGLLNKLLTVASETKEQQEKDFEQRALDKLVTMAYEKYVTCRGFNSSGGKSSSNKMAKQAALAFVKRTLERCRKFEDMGKSCFSEQLFKDMFLSGYSYLNGGRSEHAASDVEAAKPYAKASGSSLEVRVSASMGPLQSPLNGDSSDVISPIYHSSEQCAGKEDTWSNRVKKRELLLDDVVGGIICASSGPSGIGGSLSSSTKGKRSERDREGKGHGREVISRNGTNRIGRPSLSNTKGERKSKTKPKQKMTQLSASVNGLLGKSSEHPKPMLPAGSKSSDMNTNNNSKGKDDFGSSEMDNNEPLDFSQMPGIEDFAAATAADGQGQDLGSWLNFDNLDEDVLQDQDFMGLEIPMDDLSDLNMMV